MWTLVRTALTAMSCFLLLTATTFCTLSYWSVYSIGWGQNKWTGDNHLIHTHFAIAAQHGRFIFNASQATEIGGQSLSPHEQDVAAAYRTKNPGHARWYTYSDRAPATFDAALVKQSLIGFEKFAQPFRDTRGGAYAVPAWLIVALLAMLPLRWADRRRRKQNPPLKLVSAMAPAPS